jgi:peptidoglycan hydrolase-like protein with peptidoglycan-binding domain
VAVVCLAAALVAVGACSSQPGADDPPRPPVRPHPAGGVATGVAPAPARSAPAEDETSLVARLPSLRAAHHRSPRLSTALRSEAWREVALLQMALDVVGRPGPRVDGHYGLTTLYAVIRFQRESGIPVTGTAGPVTLRALAQALSSPGGVAPRPH